MHNVAELLRLIHNLIRLGTIAAVGHDAARVRVKSGELLTDWLPWTEGRAGTTRDWDPPTEGEQVIVFSPGGDPAAGVVLTGLYSRAHPAPANSGDVWHRVFPDGAVLEYDHAAHHLRADIPGSAGLTTSGAVTVSADGAIKATTKSTLNATATGGATIDANTVINGNLTLNGNFSQPAGKKATMAGDVAFKGAVTSNGKDISSKHAHDRVEPGSGTSGEVI
ncbi:phage baseplate assembly protein V [Chromohalobacter canadensis]|uniref:phage baseplate assembly protein V n=1 Tax=Chromohalobacter canadensis TaxID=141389 RepID=UPI0021BFE0F6|nr:phage baseplate assembly protein V [Chromohalobacter canadensis]MCT8469456.1 phage baseplate assembly protein V [Chromohalobacter canadensis]MCT8472080.1 phage baseplate assembly protein V [Chromohalobacter canadensis]MCT8499807.1 phage baseplate assembly protein V [Chromohalobacter canadensis]